MAKKVSEMSREELLAEREKVRLKVRRLRARRLHAKLVELGTCPTCKRSYPAPSETSQGEASRS